MGPHRPLASRSLPVRLLAATALIAVAMPLMLRPLNARFQLQWQLQWHHLRPRMAARGSQGAVAQVLQPLLRRVAAPHQHHRERQHQLFSRPNVL